MLNDACFACGTHHESSSALCRAAEKARANADKLCSATLADRQELLAERDSLRAALSAAEVARDAFATEIMDYKLELNSLREEVEQLRQHPVLIPWSESERTQLLQELAETRAEVERLKAELAWVTETELGLAKQKQNLNRAKLQAVYDALAEHCQTAKHPSPLLLEQLQSLYRLLEDPA